MRLRSSKCLVCGNVFLKIATEQIKYMGKMEFRKLESPYGLIKSSWQIQDGRLMLDILVPANTEATVVLPGCEKPVTAGSGEWHYETVYKVSGI